MIKIIIAYFLLYQSVLAMEVKTYCLDSSELPAHLTKGDLIERQEEIVTFLSSMEDLATQAASADLTDQDRIVLNLHYNSYFKNLVLAAKYIETLFYPDSNRPFQPYWFSLINYQIRLATSKGESTTLDFNILDLNQLGITSTNILTSSKAALAKTNIQNAYKTAVFSQELLKAALRTLVYVTKLYSPKKSEPQ